MYQNIKLFTEDIIANALIAKAELQGIRIVSMPELEEYAKTCQHICKTRHNIDVKYDLGYCSINEAMTEITHDKFFMRHTNGNIEIRPGVTTTDLRHKFRPYQSIDMIRCYVDAGECFRPGNLETEHMVLGKTDGTDWTEQTTLYMLLTKDKHVEFYDIGNRPQAKGLLAKLVPGSELYCIGVSGGKPMPYIVTDIRPVMKKLQELAGD